MVKRNIIVCRLSISAHGSVISELIIMNPSHCHWVNERLPAEQFAMTSNEGGTEGSVVEIVDN